ncbi:molybdopterin synthase catalytic subunit MoaE [Reinekea sp. G2M2-21]|uniref:molybdopterin synthase catalytic subunit MoaE n=1 Tax=Reinekea sp. G2M2-21 TaxID=2788942 RepID=UPI0018AC6759|nr:molybdopterin synthase catalytic subunit MoaE [Reinekea sp. G2M2-21]
MIHISVQTEDFNVQDEYDAVCQQNNDDGAVVFFVGRVRDLNQGDAVFSMTLEHYPGMTESALADIISEAQQRWPLNRVRVVHRVGPLQPSDQIVFVATSSPHREAAFAGAEFIMDYLKTRAPFWKKESTDKGERWVDAKDSDAKKADTW